MLALGIPFCPVVFPDMLSYDCPEGGRYSEVGRLLHGFSFVVYVFGKIIRCWKPE